MPLSAYHINLEPVIWDQTPIESLSNLDALIFRSCWDYHRKAARFFQFLDALENINVPVFNPVNVLRWNAHKGYLSELAAKGIASPESVLVKHNSTLRPDDLAVISSGQI